MAHIAVKKFIIYKGHIFPEIQKPLRSVQQFILSKNPELDRYKAKKMVQLLDLEQLKKINVQKLIGNQKINIDLSNYYKRYIQPMQECPQYYKILSDYVRVKTEYLLETKTNHSKIKDPQPFFIKTNEVQLLEKKLKNQQQKIDNSTKIQQNHMYLKGKKRQKMLFEVYRNLYPFQRLSIFKLFKTKYENFLQKKQQKVLNEIFQENISLIKPFLNYSPIEIYQSKNPGFNLYQCQQLIHKDAILRQKMNDLFLKELQNRQKDLNLLSTKFQTNISDILKQYRKQYENIEKQKSFYTLIKLN